VTPRENEILRQENEALRRRLAEAEQVNEALTKGQIDAVVDAAHQAPLLLRQAQEALEASEEQYRAMFDLAPVGVAQGDPATGRFLAVNPRMCLITGYPAAELLTMRVPEITHPEDRQRDWDLFQRVVKGEAPEYRIEKRYIRKDGSIAWVNINMVVLRDVAGRPTRTVATIEDIAERRLAEEQMEKLHSEYRLLLNSIGEGVHWIDVDGRIRFENPAAAGMLGYEVSELIGKPAHLTMHHTRADGTPYPVAECVIYATLRDGVSRHAEDEVFWRKDGTSFAVEYVSTPIRDERDRLTGAVVVFTDVTERRRAAEMLRESEERYRHIVETATEGICSLDAQLRITFANGAFARMLGCTPEELLGAPVERYTFPEEFDEHRERMDARRRGVAEQYERRIRRKDGKECWCLVSGAPILDSDGRFAGSFGMFTDITDRHRLEGQLRQSQKMDAIGRLAGGVAHDFNNLLTVMLGYSDVLLQGLEPGPLHEAAQEVRGAGKRAATLTRQLLAFSRKQTLVPEILDLGDVVSGLSTMVVRLIGEEVKVSVVVSPGLGRVKADRGQLEQVVVNLAVNARDAMPKGGSLIFELQNVELDDAYAATHAEVKPGPYVLLAISDTGTGMDAETQKRVFEPFFTTKETGKGTGLGLSTVHGIVHQSGGAIDVYSEPGRGTTFKVYLPRFAGDAAVRRPVSGDHTALVASETVLVVEDEAAIRQLTKLILQKSGYTVLLAESPAAAERIVGSHPGPIHLMLTDVVMPGIRGPELAERLIRLRPDLRVLYMSGYTDSAIAHHGMLDAGTEFLQKPFTPLQLTQKIREVLNRSEP
jgi:two-component system cell cycle sensor histidine kinase/response regulator CckA